MNQYKWYELINFSNEITQGDIIFGCPIPLHDKDLFDSIADQKKEHEASITIQQINAIILSQACDIKNNKIDTIVLCAIWKLQTLIDNNKYYQSSNARESLRQGKEPAYHLLSEYSKEDFIFDFSVVDFHRIYTLPKDYLKKIALNNTQRLRLLPPYREHLSQAFARYFMREGLPLDIDSKKIKTYTKAIQ
jgi:hypothetical protein